jgi:peptidoglycan hydrolase CwlO-like protein
MVSTKFLIILILLVVPSPVTSNDDVSIASLLATVQQQAATITSLQATVNSLQNTVDNAVHQQTADISHVNTQIAAINNNIAGVNSKTNDVNTRLNHRGGYSKNGVCYHNVVIVAYNFLGPFSSLNC